MSNVDNTKEKSRTQVLENPGHKGRIVVLGGAPKVTFQ